jgi:hypothetical protein
VNDAFSTPPVLILAATAATLVAGALAPAAGKAVGSIADSTTSPAVIYRCGSLYTQTPCPGATPMQADDPRTADERRQAEDITAREKRLAAALEAERLQRERPPPAPHAPATHRPANCATAAAASAATARDAPPQAEAPCTPPHHRTSRSTRAAATKASESWTAVTPGHPR